MIASSIGNITSLVFGFPLDTINVSKKLIKETKFNLDLFFRPEFNGVRQKYQLFLYYKKFINVRDLRDSLKALQGH